MDTAPTNAQIILNLLSGVIIAVVASWITVKLSLGKFYSEKWWEKKYEAYASIIEALHHMKQSYGEDIHALEIGRDKPTERQEQLTKRYHKSYDELLKRIDIGQFVLSEKAMRELTSFQNKFGQAKEIPNYFEHLDYSYGAIDTALKGILEIAKADLKAK